ncbi:MoaD/ThiS family protein [Clostridium sp. DL1XJH146]
MVKVKFFGVFASMIPKKDESGYWNIEVSEKTIKDILALTPIKDSSVKYSTFVNNKRKDSDYVLKDGDVLTVIPLLAGG